LVFKILVLALLFGSLLEYGRLVFKDTK
jgi:hypothetical protein